jgi:hypothetical protein
MYSNRMVKAKRPNNKADGVRKSIWLMDNQNYTLCAISERLSFMKQKKQFRSCRGNKFMLQYRAVQGVEYWYRRKVGNPHFSCV